MVDLALRTDRWQLQWLCSCVSPSAEPAAVTPLHEGNAQGDGAFLCSSASLHLGQDSLEGHLHSGSWDLLTELCSDHLGAVFVHAKEL